jgi:hypothetical protein
MAKTAEEKAAAKAAKDAEKAAAASVPVDPGTPGQNPEAVATPKPSKTSVAVKYRDHAGNETSRTFSKEVHGEDFAKLADEFKATNASKIIE